MIKSESSFLLCWVNLYFVEHWFHEIFTLTLKTAPKNQSWNIYFTNFFPISKRITYLMWKLVKRLLHFSGPQLKNFVKAYLHTKIIIWTSFRWKNLVGEAWYFHKSPTIYREIFLGSNCTLHWASSHFVGSKILPKYAVFISQSCYTSGFEMFEIFFIRFVETFSATFNCDFECDCFTSTIDRFKSKKCLFWLVRCFFGKNVEF